MPKNIDEVISHKAAIAADREATEKARSVPAYAPVLTLEQRVTALEQTVAALSTPAEPQPEAPSEPEA